METDPWFQLFWKFFFFFFLFLYVSSTAGFNRNISSVSFYPPMEASQSRCCHDWFRVRNPGLGLHRNSSTSSTVELGAFLPFILFFFIHFFFNFYSRWFISGINGIGNGNGKFQEDWLLNREILATCWVVWLTFDNGHFEPLNCMKGTHHNQG